MERLIVVERLDRRGKVVARSFVEHLPFRIGRAYDCDLILDDPHASPVHGVVERDEEGRLALRDAGSLNGIEVERDGTTASVVPLGGDVTVRLGRTTLRLRPPDFAVEDALPIVDRSTLTRWLSDHWSAALAVPLVYLAVSQLRALQATTGAYDPIDAVSNGLLELLILVGWAALWALLNRLLRQRTRYVAHASVAFLLSTATVLFEWGLEWLRFVLPPIEPLQLLSVAGDTLLFGALLFGHLTVLNVARRIGRAGIAAGCAAALLSILLLSHYTENEDWVYALPYWSRLEPVDPAWLPTEPVGTFFERGAGLVDELDALAQAALEERDETSDDTEESS